MILKQIDARGTLTLPVEVRQGLDLVSVERRADGVIELRPQVAVDRAQAWFWSSRWQAMELQAEADIRQGAVHRVTGTEFLEVISKAAETGPTKGAASSQEEVGSIADDQGIYGGEVVSEESYAYAAAASR